MERNLETYRDRFDNIQAGLVGEVDRGVALIKVRYRTNSIPSRQCIDIVEGRSFSID